MVIERGPIPLVPTGWDTTSLGEMCEINPKDIAELPDDVKVTFVPMKAVNEGSGEITNPELRTLREVRRGYTRFKENDILFAKITPCMENGKIAIARELANGIGRGSTEFHVLRPHADVSPEYIYHFLRQKSFRKIAARNMKGTAGQLRVSADYLRSVRFHVPPLAEQHRVVAKIETVLFRTKEASSAIALAKARLRLYRQALLNAGVLGRLTDDRRGKGKISGGVPSISSRRDSVSDGRVASDSQLPDSWIDLEIGSAVEIIDYRGRTPPYSEQGIPHIRTSNIRGGEVIWTDLRYVSEETYSKYMTRGIPVEGDLLFATEAPLGEVAQIPEVKFSVAQRLMLLRPKKGILDSKFLMYQLMSDDFRTRLVIRATGTTVKGISSRNLKPITIHVPPIQEQRLIASRIHERLEHAANIEQQVDYCIRNSEMMVEAFLRDFFEGKMVPKAH